MGIYCVERVLSAELPVLAMATTPKEQVQHNIFPYKCNNTFIIHFDIVLNNFPWFYIYFHKILWVVYFKL